MKSINPIEINIMAIHARACREDRENKIHALEGQAFMELHCWKCSRYETNDCPGITAKMIKADKCPDVVPMGDQRIRANYRYMG